MADPALDVAIWPTAVLFCVRKPLEHPAQYRPYESYPKGYPNIFGPPRRERCECGSLMYVAGARPWSVE